MDNLESFINSSTQFNSFTFKGNFNMSKDHFFEMFKFYIETCENLLDDYANIYTLQWREVQENGGGNILTFDEFALLDYQIHHILLKTFFSIEHLNGCLNLGCKWYDNYLELQGYKFKRASACLYTSKSKIRELVFKIHGKKCLCCNSENRIALDHVIPVRLGGENTIENLQPLCSSCNSKKGVTISDYRTVKLN